MPMDKRTGKRYPDYEGVGDITEPLPGMPSPIEQAYIDRMEKKRAASQDGGNLMLKNEMKTERMQKEKRKVPGMKHGGKVSSASKRADGCAQRGKTRGKIV